MESVAMKTSPDFIVENLEDFDELKDFYCGEEQMDDFIRGNLKECSINHYCKTYCVRCVSNNVIAAIFSLSFDSVDIDHDDFDDMRIGAANIFGGKQEFQGKNIGANIIENVCEMARKQSLGGCLFITVLALHKSNYSAVPFYEKCHFAKQTPLPKADVWPMYKTLWVEEPELQ